MLRITLIKYISKEIWSIFLTCMLVLLLIAMASQVLNMATKFIINYGAGVGDVVYLIICLVPEFILVTLPAACLMAVLLSFIRMASDNEIIALHSSGISLYQLMPPVIIFSFICFLFAGFLTLFWAPYGNRAYETVSINLMEAGIESKIKEGIFLEEDKFVLYVNSYSPKDKIMKDIFAVIKRNEKEETIIAKKARLKPDGIELIDYKILSEDESIIGESQDSTMYRIPLHSIKSSENDEIGPEGMYFDELLGLMNNPEESPKRKNIAKLILYEMFSLPVAVMIIGIVGAPLGAQIRAKGRTKGIIISLLLFLCYYGIFLSAEVMCENGTIDPAVGVWLPALFLLIISVFIFFIPTGRLSSGFVKRLTFLKAF